MALNQGFEYRERINQRTAGATLLDHLTQRYARRSRAVWLPRLQAGRVLVDGASAAHGTVLRAGQCVILAASAVAGTRYPS